MPVNLLPSIHNSKVIFVGVFQWDCIVLLCGRQAILGRLALRVVTEVNLEIDFT